MPDVGTLQRLRHVIGFGQLAELSYTVESFDAVTALRTGLVTRVFDDVEQLQAVATALAQTIATKSPLTVRGIKRNLLFARDHDVADGLAYTAAPSATCRERRRNHRCSPPPRHLRAALLQRHRPPVRTGRREHARADPAAPMRRARPRAQIGTRVDKSDITADQEAWPQTGTIQRSSVALASPRRSCRGSTANKHNRPVALSSAIDLLHRIRLRAFNFALE